MSRSSLSVVIPSYNDARRVERCVTSLRQYSSGRVTIEFLIQDDCSPDIDLRMEPVATRAQVARNPERMGFAGTCNAGAARANSQYLFFVNQDVYAFGKDAHGSEPSEDWDLALLSAFDRRDVGVVGAKLLYPDGSIQNAGGLFDERCQPYHRLLGSHSDAALGGAASIVVSWTTGAALGVRRSIFQQLSGFDTVFRIGYFEDVDLCLRARDLGYRVFLEARCVLAHEVGTSKANAFFSCNARTFWRRWVKSGRIQPDSDVVVHDWW